MNKVSQIIISIIFSLCCLMSAQAQIVKPNTASLRRDGGYMEVTAPMALSELTVKSNEAVIITPTLVNGNDSLVLQSVGVYGHRRYLYYLRNYGGPLTGSNEQTFQTKDRPDSLQYEQVVPFSQWMDGASLRIDYRTYGCCNTVLSETHQPSVADYAEFHPVYIYAKPTSEGEKFRSISGSAFVDFPVDQTVIYPEYRNNTVELGKINASIDSVRGDADITINEVWLKGFASPESPYKHNTDLARGRVAALKEHVQRLYSFDEGVIATEYEPEDWAGLRRYVDKSNLEHRSEILALIDSDMDPDKKELKIKTTYPQEYRFMLENWYPALRHTDYRIDYTVRTFYDPKEIAEVMKTAPSKLDLNEFYVLANSLDPDSKEYAEVFDTAVRLYPDDEIANLNAAIGAMQRGDMQRAAAYLAKAGDSEEAEYARGVYYVNTEDYPQAAAHLQRAADAGNTYAADALTFLKK